MTLQEQWACVEHNESNCYVCESDYETSPDDLRAFAWSFIWFGIICLILGLAVCTGLVWMIASLVRAI